MRKILIISAGVLGLFLSMPIVDSYSFDHPFHSSHRENHRPNSGMFHRIENLESDLGSLRRRVARLEDQLDQNENRGPTFFWFCRAQCEGQSSTSASGRGRSRDEAIQKAFEAIREKWVCSLEVVSCSQEE